MKTQLLLRGHVAAQSVIWGPPDPTTLGPLTLPTVGNHPRVDFSLGSVRYREMPGLSLDVPHLSHLWPRHEPRSSRPLGLPYGPLSEGLPQPCPLGGGDPGGDPGRGSWKVSFLRAGALSVLLRLEPRACAWLDTAALSGFLKVASLEGSGPWATHQPGKGLQVKCRTPSQIQISDKQSIAS